MAKQRIINDVKITGIADKGKGIARDADGKVIFVDQVAVGDVINLRVTKKKKDYLEGVKIALQEASEDRVKPFCEHYGACGGCQFQHVSYEAQLRYKQEVVENAIRRIGRIEVAELLPILPAARTQYYRNKLEFAFSNKQWLTPEQFKAGVSFEKNVLGFHRQGAFDKIVDIQHCYLQDDPSNAIRNFARQKATEMGLTFWDAREQHGQMRHILIRVTTTGEIMLIVSFFENHEDDIKKLLDSLLEAFPQITTLYYCINPKVNDYVLDLDMILYHGKGFIEEQLGEVNFRIGPKSFFQTNSHQAKVLYDVVADFAQFQGHENVYDLYTGLGSIAQYVAHKCRQVTGIEEIAAAIDDAWQNAERNDIKNCIFYAGDVKDILSPDFIKKHGKPDVVITDPPRAGMHKDVVETLLKLQAPRIVYVSCNPATQARDMNLLAQKYDVLKVQPVDMFPNTHHIESVALLELRKSGVPVISKIKNLFGING